jgi:hypothetical protein
MCMKKKKEMGELGVRNNLCRAFNWRLGELKEKEKRNLTDIINNNVL